MQVRPHASIQQNAPSCDPLEIICERVFRRFNRAYPIPVAVHRLDGKKESMWVNGAEVPSVHPTCRECRDRETCGVRWKAGAADPSAPQSASCPAGHLVSFVPLRYDGKALALFQLVEPGTLPRASFQHRTTLLADIVAESASGPDASTASKPKLAAAATWWRPARTGIHPQVQKAIEYVEEHLSDPRTNVATVARVLGINSTYLSHIFSEQMGTRMSRYIASRRIQLAKKLLATTDWQIKRIAFESGHTNADWFSQVFHTYAGMTPCNYRLLVRSKAAAAE